MSLRSLRSQLDKMVEKYAPRCVPVRELIFLDEGDPEPVRTPCLVCGELGCGVRIIREIVITERRSDGMLVSSLGNVYAPPEFGT